MSDPKKPQQPTPPKPPAQPPLTERKGVGLGSQSGNYINVNPPPTKGGGKDKGGKK